MGQALCWGYKDKWSLPETVDEGEQIPTQTATLPRESAKGPNSQGRGTEGEAVTLGAREGSLTRSL